MRSLRARFTIVTITVAVLAVLITSLVSIQLVRSASRDEAQRQLVAEANSFATTAGINSLDDVAVTDGAYVALISPKLAISGSAAPYIAQPFARRLRLEKSISTVRRVNGETAFVEARQTPSGYGVVLALPQAKIDATIRNASGRIILALLIGTAVAALAAALLTRLVSRPLTETAQLARRLAAGERGVHPPSRQPTEVAAISTALSTLDDALATSEGRQREFLLSISHELRTPLTALRGYGEALADGIVTDVPEVGRTLVAETERLTLFVSDLLELARLEADDFSVSPADVPLDELFGQVLGAWSGRATGLGVGLVTAPTGITVRTDPRRLRQILDGLVENALRVSPAKTTISLSATPVGASVDISVTDAGPGLTEDDLTVAFDRGALHAAYRETRPVGTGLGLSIAARLSARLGGGIRAGNAAAGGAVFTVTLPLV